LIIIVGHAVMLLFPNLAYRAQPTGGDYVQRGSMPLGDWSDVPDPLKHHGDQFPVGNYTLTTEQSLRVRQASLPSHIMIPPGFVPPETRHAAQHLPISPGEV
jgi:hypothetical protein